MRSDRDGVMIRDFPSSIAFDLAGLAMANPRGTNGSDPSRHRPSAIRGARRMRPRRSRARRRWPTSGPAFPRLAGRVPALEGRRQPALNSGQGSFQQLGKLGRGSEALGGVLGMKAFNECGQPRGDVGIDLAASAAAARPRLGGAQPASSWRETVDGPRT